MADDTDTPTLEVVDDLPAAVAEHLAELARTAINERGSFVLALSGGSTPVPMFHRLFAADLDWARVTLLQVDERVAPAGHADRNLTAIDDAMEDTPAVGATLLPMPVEASDLDHAVARYVDSLQGPAGDPVTIDAVQLGLGDDGHTASLVPGDPVLDVTEADVAVTGEYEGRRRMTLTYPVLNRARHLVWMVADASKAEALQGLLDGDPALPASGIRRDAVVFADPAAAGQASR